MMESNKSPQNEHNPTLILKTYDAKAFLTPKALTTTWGLWVVMISNVFPISLFDLPP